MKRALLWFAGAVLLLAAALAWRHLARSPAERVGAVLWEMTEIGTAARDALVSSRIGAGERRRLVDRAAHRLAADRDSLAELAGDLDPDSELAVRLRQFVERWPSESAFREDLLSGEANGYRSGAEITGLAWLAPDTRFRWSTPFRIFRP